MYVKLSELRIDYKSIKYYVPVESLQIKIVTDTEELIANYVTTEERNKALRSLDAFIGISCC